MFGGIGSPEFAPNARVTAAMLVVFTVNAIVGMIGMVWCWVHGP